MLLGEFNHSIDEKGRLIIPAKLRDDLGDSFVICNGLEGCLFVYSQEEWNKFVAELETLPRMSKDARIFKRYFFGSASEGSFDKQGRVQRLDRKSGSASRYGIRLFGRNAVRSARKIWTRLQSVWNP